MKPTLKWSCACALAPLAKLAEETGATAVLNALYNHLLSLPETREFFETQDNPAP